MTPGEIGIGILVLLAALYFAWSLITGAVGDDGWQLDDREDFMVNVRRRRR